MTGAGFAADERFARLRLARTEGIGAAGFARLIARHGSGRAACRALEGEGKPLADPRLLEEEMARAAAIVAQHVFLGEGDYPPLLAEVRNPPPVLVLTGDPALARRPVVAIVGARNASAAGVGMATELAQGLSDAGVVVVSGMARGIDGAAHRASLAGGTIACVAGGIDVAYPPENEELQWQVAERGLLVSEAPPRTEPVARRFPRRNRLIAGMALGVVVVEGATGSGSLITARIALDEGREVMAVPGHPRDPRSAGGNALIREGALLVERTADILDALDLAPEPAPMAPPVRKAPAPVARNAQPRPASGDTDTLLPYLSVAPTPIDALVELTGRPVADIQAELSALEIEGEIERVAGGRVRRSG